MQLERGSAAPFFSRVDDQGNPVTLDDYAGHRLVIYFYPRAFTPGCTTESCDFRDNHEAFAAAGYQIIGVSPDPVERLADFRAKHGLPFPLLSDEDHTMAEAYGAWGTKTSYGKKSVGLIRSTVVVGGDGTIERAWYNVRAAGHAGRVAGEVLD